MNELGPIQGSVIGRMMRWCLEVRDGDLPVPPPERVAPGSPRDPIGHAKKPVGQKTAIANRGCLANQDQESRLEGVLDVPGVAQKPAAQAQHHGTMEVDQRFKSGLISASEVALQ